MQAGLCVKFVIFSGFVTVFSVRLPVMRDRTCKSIRPMRNLNEIRHQGRCVVFGGNIRCDDCCMTYDMILKKPGHFITRNTNYTSSGPGTPVDFNDRRIRLGSYKSDDGMVYMLSTDYASYHVVYLQPGRFLVLIRSLDVLKDKCTRNKIFAAFTRQSQICRVKYYPYNIEKACRQYKPID